MLSLNQKIIKNQLLKFLFNIFRVFLKEKSDFYNYDKEFILTKL